METGIPRKTKYPADSDHTHKSPPLEDQLSQLTIPDTKHLSKTDHNTSDVDSSGSDNEQGPPHPKGVLLDAGVVIDLDSLSCSDGGSAPLELLSQVNLVIYSIPL